MIALSCDHKAPEGMFRVIWVDVYERIGGYKQDCTTIEEAIRIADENAKEMLEMRVHDSKRELLYIAEKPLDRGVRIDQLKRLVKRGLLTAESFVELA